MSAPFRLVHFTDPHVFRRRDYRPWHVLSKRLLGGINEFVFRRREHGLGVAEAAFAALPELGADHLLVTGDLSSLGTDDEFYRFRRLLEHAPLDASAITVIPGNHDAYVPAVHRRRRFQTIFADYLRSDPDLAHPPGPRGFPVARVRGPLALLACSTAHPSAPFMAVGTLGAQQLARLETLLAADAVRDRFQLVALHHHPQLGVGKWHNRLVDGPAFRALLSRAGADLVLHGHLHKSLQATLRGPDRDIPVRGTASLSCRLPDALHRGQIRVFNIDRDHARLRSEESYRYHESENRFVRETAP